MTGKTLLIGGTSHLGKSTLASQLVKILDAEQISTDQLARHPGRPWKATMDLIPKHVIEHYEQLGIDELIEDVSAHYQRQWPRVQALIADKKSAVLIIEGSAIGPSWVASHLTDNIVGIWLVASPELIKQRIYTNSHYEQKSSRAQVLIDKFCQRSIQFNELIKTEVRRYSLPYLEIDHGTTRIGLAQECLLKIGWTVES
ncbi:MAG: hypothetical protein KTR30_34570 [Saprospiraceae bacterium]|nr:hypothetical protein [Saprospiraceae bacterium]